MPAISTMRRARSAGNRPRQIATHEAMREAIGGRHNALKRACRQKRRALYCVAIGMEAESRAQAITLRRRNAMLYRRREIDAPSKPMLMPLSHM